MALLNSKQILFFTSLFFCSAAKTQTLTCANTCPQAGQVYSMRTASPVTGASGQNKLWNFSNVFAPGGGYPIYTYIGTSAYPSYTAYPNCNVILKGKTDITYLRTGSNGIEAFYPSTFIANKPRMVLPLPFSFGSTYKDTVITKSIADNDTIVCTTINSFSGSGTGTLVLPNNVTYNNVLQIRHYSTWSYLKNNLPFNDTYTNTTVMYYQPGIAQYLASYSQIMTSGLADFGPKTELLDAITTGLAGQSQQFGDIEIAPNPAQNHLQIRLGSETAHTLSLYSMLGQILTQVESTQREDLLDVADLARGIYVLVIEQEGVLLQKKILLD